MSLNENAILDAFYSNLLDEMKIGDSINTVLSDEQFVEEEQQQQLLVEVLLPELIFHFADKYDGHHDPDGADLQNFFDVFCQFEHISQELSNLIAATINEIAKEDNDNDDGVLSQDDWENLSDQERILKVKAFLKAIANSGDNNRDMKPFIKRGPGPDCYGNEWGKNVQVFDRSTNRFGHTPENPTTAKGTNSYLQRKSSLPNLPIHEALLDPHSAQKVERYAQWLHNNQWLTKPVKTSESPKEALMATGKLRNEHNKKFALGKDQADWDPVTDARIKGKRK